MVDEKMIAWAAGIYEGEGTNHRTIPICITQKDTWILYKLQGLFGGKVRLNRHKCSDWVMYGEHGRAVLKLFLPYLSPWRLKQIEDNKVLDYFNLETHCRNGHERTKWNTYTSPLGFMCCRTCRNISNKKYKKNKAA